MLCRADNVIGRNESAQHFHLCINRWKREGPMIGSVSLRALVDYRTTWMNRGGRMFARVPKPCAVPQLYSETVTLPSACTISTTATWPSPAAPPSLAFHLAIAPNVGVLSTLY